MSIAEHHVGGLQVAMDDAVLVRELQRVGELHDDGDRFAERDPLRMRSENVPPSSNSIEM